MTNVLLILAGPTKWDAEGRLSGSHSLPLSADGEIAIKRLLGEAGPPPVDVVYTSRKHEACEQAAQLVARHYGVKLKDEELLEPMSLGLWQGLTRAELRFRFPTVFGQWEEDARSVNPPGGESLGDAAARLREGARRVLRRNRGGSVAIVLRPLAMQVVSGVLRGLDLAGLAGHLRDVRPVERIEVSDDDDALGGEA